MSILTDWLKIILKGAERHVRVGIKDKNFFIGFVLGIAIGAGLGVYLFLEYNKPSAAIAERKKAVAARDIASTARDVAVAGRYEATIEKEKAIAAKNAAETAKDIAVADRFAAVTERDKAVVERDKAIAARQKAIEDRNIAFKERDEAIAALDAYKRRDVDHLSGFYLGLDAGWLAGDLDGVADEAGARVGGFVGYGFFPGRGSVYIGSETGGEATFAGETNAGFYLAARLGIKPTALGLFDDRLFDDTLFYISSGWLRTSFGVDGEPLFQETKYGLRTATGFEMYLSRGSEAGHGLALGVEYVIATIFRDANLMRAPV